MCTRAEWQRARLVCSQFKHVHASLHLLIVILSIAGLRGAGAVFGVFATFIFAPLVSRFGLIKTGAMSITYQVAFLSIFSQYHLVTNSF